MKLSLCMIVKADDKEAKLLDRCLSYVAPHVDEICLTITGKNKKCEEVAKRYNAKVSHFEWINDFAKARNFNFSQATGDYILWLDCDDVLKGGENLEKTVETMAEEKIDAVVMNYLYDFNESGICTVKHLKTRIVKNDGCVEWVGELHEDFNSTRELKSFLSEDIEVLHLTSEKRARQSAKRNLDIAKKSYLKNPKDPRSLYLMANAHLGAFEPIKAAEFLKEFVKVSQSEEEKYLAYITLSDIYKETPEEAKQYALKALDLRPIYPNAYHKLGDLNYSMRKLDTARNFYEIGLQLPRPEKDIIVFNPREYDYIPMVQLVNISFEKGEYSKAFAALNQVLEMFPEDKNLLTKKRLIEASLGEAMKADEEVKKMESMSDEELMKYLETLPQELRMHPKVCLYRNTRIIKTETTGKDLVYYCSYTTKSWSPKETSVGGSEEAVMNLSKELAKLGWNVTVYNNCGKNAGTYEGVTYKPFWEYNVRDKQDVTIYWRHPRFVDYHENGGRVFIDMHDVIQSGEFNSERMAKIEKVFVKSEAHKKVLGLKEKTVIVPNGIKASEFASKAEKNPYLILNTSSPDRHLEATLDVFEELIKRQPEKPWKLAWFYGWGVYDDVHKENKEMMDWKNKQMDRFNKLVKEGRAEGGYMLTQEEITKKYMEAGYFLYPTQFFEIDCISARKAQAAGCKVITSDFAALNETVKHGLVIHTEGEKWGKESTFGDTENTEKFVDAIIGEGGIKEGMEMRVSFNGFDAIQYDWKSIANNWNKTLCA